MCQDPVKPQAKTEILIRRVLRAPSYKQYCIHAQVTRHKTSDTRHHLLMEGREHPPTSAKVTARFQEDHNCVVPLDP